MNGADKALLVFIIIFMISFLTSYKYGYYMISRTGLFFAHVMIAGTIHISIGIMALIGWFYFSWGVNAFLLYGGLVLGVGLIAVGEIVLLLMLFIKRKKMMVTFEQSNKLV